MTDEYNPPEPPTEETRLERLEQRVDAIDTQHGAISEQLGQLLHVFEPLSQAVAVQPPSGPVMAAMQSIRNGVGAEFVVQEMVVDDDPIAFIADPLSFPDPDAAIGAGGGGQTALPRPDGTSGGGQHP
jgi:hypothetical protein